MLTLRLWHDDDGFLDNPNDWGGWTLHSFSSRHRNYTDPEEFFPDGKLPIGLRRKLACGTAFLLSYYEHGNCLWTLQGELPPGARCPWDSVGLAGILIGDANNLPRGTKERHDDAAAFVQTFTDWCNGSVYGFTLSDEDGKVIDSCGGFYVGADDGKYMFDTIREACKIDSIFPPDNRLIASIEGDCAWLADGEELPLAAGAA